jgi:hypothetical protein
VSCEHVTRGCGDGGGRVAARGGGRARMAHGQRTQQWGREIVGRGFWRLKDRLGNTGGDGKRRWRGALMTQLEIKI